MVSCPLNLSLLVIVVASVGPTELVCVRSELGSSRVGQSRSWSKTIHSARVKHGLGAQQLPRLC